ncbi:ABC transporter substrate-binding protein [Rhodopila sp.]|jgi:branched-chain amino acid transport system substrate-binding protein|uniref:ABC transporter substrate-binding protein n=1 Tax=Rhodopila sp. TaxID=2480087 RepID=UPI002C55D0A5|nr:ABC transporter substrate-binding protein [Rhodopila sp.]HVZ10036.1 ABC transporter substrate-binding protein [Rhodopila sp.]
MLTRRAALGATATLATVAGTRRVRAQSGPVIRIGVINDQSGVYRDVGGLGSVVCVKQAVADFATQNGLNVEVLAADHQNKPDIGLAIAREWFDQGVDVITDVQGSGVALALAKLARERDKVMLACNVATSELTGKSCSPNTLHFGYDTYMTANVTGSAVVKQGGDSWFILFADYAFGKQMKEDLTTVVTRHGGKVLGSLAVPFPNTDFSSMLVQAQASGAKVIGLAEAGADLINVIKQAAEFGVVERGQKLAAFVMFINDVHGLGLRVARGLQLTNVYYWDRDDRSRAFAKRVWTAMGNAPPNMSQASNYSATLHYMKAVKALGPAEAKKSGAAAVKWMKAHKLDDDVLQGASIRADGRVMSQAFLCEVKKPEESKYPWDYYHIRAVIPPDQAWRSLADGGCPLAS